MIQNDEELKVTRERIAYLLDVLARLRIKQSARGVGPRIGRVQGEVERMQREVLDYLTQPASQTTAKGWLSNRGYRHACTSSTVESKKGVDWRVFVAEAADEPRPACEEKAGITRCPSRFIDNILIGCRTP